MKGFFGGGSKKPASPAPQENEHRISLGRTDGIESDLNKVLSSTNLQDIISNAKSSDNLQKTKDETEDHGKIAVTRSDGVNHCIINVFKGMSDATGDTMTRTNVSDAGGSSSRLSVGRSLSATKFGGTYFPPSVRIVHMSDTGSFLSANAENNFLPKGDILVHSGNFTMYGAKREFEQFNAWLGSVEKDFKFRVVTLGCRDVKEFGNNWDVMKKLLPNATHVLCHEPTVILGIRFYGCPWHWGHHKNYKVRAGAPASTTGRFDEIPEEVQVLVTHGAAAGVLDTVNLPGARELGDSIRRAKPGLHLHGHSKGAHGVAPSFGKYPLVCNSAQCDAEFQVMYACPHVVKASQLTGTDATMTSNATANWNFQLDSLMIV
jgi:hypothetical protein